MTRARTLEWADGHVTLHPRGAMIRDLALRLSDGRWHHPLHRAPWVGTAEGDRLPGLMAGLAGDWPCVPFGTPTTRLPPAWRGAPGWEDPFPHGHAANHDWTLTHEAGALEAVIDMPVDHPIARMARRIVPVAGGIACALTVTPRRDAALPIGLHPVFRLPDLPESLQVEIAGAGPVFAHPEDPAPDPTPLAPGAVFDRLDRVVTAGGAALDLSLLPLREECEIRVLVPATGGLVRLINRDDGVEARLGYDARIFPSVMLWISNRGRSGPPWNGRHLALGVEPVCAPFDLGVMAAQRASPLTARGVPVAHGFRAGQPLRTEHRITAGLSDAGTG